MPRGKPWTLNLLLAKTQKMESGCVEWIGYRDDNGYGGTRFRGAPDRAHRVSWVLSFGEIPNGLWVLHHCDNPPCVRPEHLFLGVQKDNMQDCIAKGRHVPPPQELSVLARRKFIPQLNEIIAARSRGETLDSISARLGVPWGTVQRIANGTHWQQRG